MRVLGDAEIAAEGVDPVAGGSEEAVFVALVLAVDGAGIGGREAGSGSVASRMALSSSLAKLTYTMAWCNVLCPRISRNTWALGTRLA